MSILLLPLCLISTTITETTTSWCTTTTLSLFLLLKRNLTVPSILVCPTVAEIAIAIIWCTMEIVHIIWTTISHFDICWPFTAACSPVKTHRPGNLTVCYSGVSTVHPSGSICATSACRWTWSWNSYACWALKTKPTRSDFIVTITVVSNVRNLSVTAVKTSVILTFWYRK